MAITRLGVKMVNVMAVNANITRRRFPPTEERIVEIQNSMRESGQRYPIVVRPNGRTSTRGSRGGSQEYDVVCGATRLLAARRLHDEGLEQWAKIKVQVVGGLHDDYLFEELSDDVSSAGKLDREQLKQARAELAALRKQLLATIADAEPAKGGRGKKGGLSEAARQAGVTPEAARKAKSRARKPVTDDHMSRVSAEPSDPAPNPKPAPEPEPERKSAPVVQQRHCSFCHKSEKEVRILIDSCSADICRDCVESFHSLNHEPTAEQIAYDERRRMEIIQLASRLIDRDPKIAREVEKVLSDEVFGLREAAFRLALAINHRLQAIKFGVDDDDDADDDDEPRHAPKGCGENPGSKGGTKIAPPAANADDGLGIPEPLRRAPKDAAAGNIDGWQEVEPGIFEKVIDGKAERSAAFHPDLPDKDVADVLQVYEAPLMEPVHQRALDQWTAENGWRLTPTEARGHVWRKVIDGKPYGICIVADTADIARALTQAEKQERTRRKAAARREANKRAREAA